MSHDRPNILMVMLDSARPEWLSCYDPAQGASPNIDRVASDALVFERAIGPSAWTFPVMASVFTGMLPTKHGGHDEHQSLDTNYPTMAEVLSRHGYDTAAFADVPYVGPSTRLDRGFGVLSNLRSNQVSPFSAALKALGRVRRVATGRYHKTFETRVVIGECLHWLEHGWDRSRPFFLYVHSDETHAPFLPPARFRERFSRLTHEQMHAINQDKQLFVGGQVKMTDEDFENLRNLARAEVAYFDEWLGVFLKRLQRYVSLDDTIVVIAADHGDNFGEHGLMRHGLCLYDTLTHVPLIVRLPGGRQAARVRSMVQSIDLLPTFMAAAGIHEPETVNELQGSDLTEQVRSGRFARFAVSELYRPSTGLWERKVPQFMPEFRRRFDRVLRSYRTNTHKFIWSSNGVHELFDLEKDPGETRNLFDTDPTLALQMHGELDLWLESFHHAFATESVQVEDDADERVMERLRDLGYVE